ncbi:hypothetical protein H0H81_008245 [Sphagnurus paluster]|uniref:Laccase n=1 Tax=Sphagnurus paluster TaxID=117069 RepID=A0A9P7FSR6_9AGAR|nr:hypothetical protein H0H81_008245 [Sphagnurus paluster]
MFSAMNVLALFAIPFVGLASAKTVSLDMVIGNRVISPDGYSRPTVLAGGTFPGPLIKGDKGDQFQLNVINSLSDPRMLRSTSIHWHGIFQNRTNFADGAAFVTQCPIAANDSFLYDFPVNGQAGTYWYHSHLSTQYCDGLRGPFVVYDPADPYVNMYDIDDESTIITLADWYHRPALEWDENTPSPKAEATLINGKGRCVDYKCDATAPLSVINVIPGKRYRFRVIGLSCDPSFNFAIDKHSLTIIEADGEYTAPLVVDSVVIHAGQRYSVIMTANQPVGNYWIRADPDVRGFPGFDRGRNSAILRYQGALVADPTTTYSSTRPMKETNLRALINPKSPGSPVLGGADVTINLAHAFNFQTLRFEVNGVTYKDPKMPVLLQILSGSFTAQELLPKGSVYTLPPNSVIEISMPGSSAVTGGPVSLPDG